MFELVGAAIPYNKRSYEVGIIVGTPVVFVGGGLWNQLLD
ncbi:hypothetical protein QOZ95_004386 [Paenibacillus brasilensis]|uniref:Uncharacterized protein n=1 Tax=Paenibacillus brasilensis TaxID=128574 RepID=A0ABU0L4J0_9BACL|nr:hypothetical protein [Paenibacillus brasilensis]